MDGFLDARHVCSCSDPQFAVPPTCMPARLVIDGTRTRRYLNAGKSLVSCHITAGPAENCSTVSRYVPCRVAKYGTRLCCVGDSLRQCGSVRIRTSDPCFGAPPATHWSADLSDPTLSSKWAQSVGGALFESPKTASASASQCWSRRNRYLSDRLSHEAWHLKRA